MFFFIYFFIKNKMPPIFFHLQIFFSKRNHSLGNSKAPHIVTFKVEEAHTLTNAKTFFKKICLFWSRIEESRTWMIKKKTTVSRLACAV